jgi:signal transduction histidine kinase
VSLDLGDVWLPELAERVAARFRSQTTKHPLVLKFQNNYPHVMGDEAKLRQVLENLVSNAIKYSPNGGSIEIGGRYDAQWASVYIRDQGVGIAQADQGDARDGFGLILGQGHHRRASGYPRCREQIGRRLDVSSPVAQTPLIPLR